MKPPSGLIFTRNSKCLCQLSVSWGQHAGNNARADQDKVSNGPAFLAIRITRLYGEH